MYRGNQAVRGFKECCCVRVGLDIANFKEFIDLVAKIDGCRLFEILDVYKRQG